MDDGYSQNVVNVPWFEHGRTNMLKFMSVKPQWSFFMLYHSPRFAFYMKRHLQYLKTLYHWRPIFDLDTLCSLRAYVALIGCVVFCKIHWLSKNAFLFGASLKDTCKSDAMKANGEKSPSLFHNARKLCIEPYLTSIHVNHTHIHTYMGL